MPNIEATTMDDFVHSLHRETSNHPVRQSEVKSGHRRLPDIVTRDEAGRVVTAPERLSNVAGDTMTLHTSEALRLFVGQAGDVRWRVEPIVGGKHFASALKEMWFLSARDHPYADWMLIRAYDELATLRASIAEVTKAWQGRLDDIRRKGLSIGVMESARPVGVSLGFRSPYGYAVAAAVVEFDHFVRVVQTLVLKDQLAPAQGQSEILKWINPYYDLFRKSMKWKRLLLLENLKSMTRKDFRPHADDEACQRVRAAVGYFGSLPRGVLVRENVPRHVRQVRMAPLSPMPDSDDDTMLDVSAVADTVNEGDHPHQQLPVGVPDVSRETSVAPTTRENNFGKAVAS